MPGASWRVWVEAARPATLPAIAGPVLVGGALAYGQGAFRPVLFAATLVAALLIQTGTNFANDVADFERGADGSDRLGPRRVTASGAVAPARVRLATLIVFAAAALLGLYLIRAGGWPILVVGVTSIVAGVTYTGGPWPYGYRGLGDLFVFVFFGLVAVCGTYYLQTGAVSVAALFVALPVACTVTAVLVVNNLRDLPTDRAVGKRTLAVVLGERWSRLEYAALMLAPFALVSMGAATGLLPGGALLVWLALPAVGVVAWRVLGGTAGRELNPVLKRTALTHLLVAVLLALGVVL